MKTQQEVLDKVLEHVRAIGENLADLSRLVQDSEYSDTINECIQDHYPFDKSLDEIHGNIWSAYVTNKIKEIAEGEKTIPISYGVIKASFGWSRFCEVTGGNPYAINEGYDPDDRELFDVTLKQARLLGIVS